MQQPQIPAAVPVHMNPTLQHFAMSLLLHSDEHAPMIADMVDPGAWVAAPMVSLFLAKVYAYIKAYGQAPKDALDALVEDTPASDQSERDQLRIMLAHCAPQPGLPIEYVMDQLRKFYRQATVRRAVLEAAQLVNDPDQIDLVEQMLTESMVKRLDAFDPGVTLRDAIERRLQDKGEDFETARLSTGITLFDTIGAIPRRKSMTLFMSPQKFGKSWWLCHMAKRALIEGKSVLHVTLENDREETMDRYLQAFGSFAREYNCALQERGAIVLEENQLANVAYIPRVLENVGDFTKWAMDFNTHYFADKLRIRYFPSKTLTIRGLISYMDMLEIRHKFVPDVLMVDYPDLMRFGRSARDYRLELGMLFAELRGLAGERNLFLLVPSQVGRDALKSKKVEREHVAEDISKISTSDLVYSYTRTEDEEKIRMGRVYVVACRYARDNVEALIAHDYATGQFVLESVEMSSSWAGKVTNLARVRRGEPPIQKKEGEETDGS